MNKCNSTNRYSRFSWIMFFSGLVGFLIAIRLAPTDYSYFGWLFGGALMGAGMMFGYVPPAKRSVLKWAYMLTAPGVTMGIVYHLIG